MALITCPKCGKQFSEHAKACPQCGISIEEALLLIQKREEESRLAAEREAAERERIRKEREAKEAEEARIRAEQRAEWWAANKKKVGIAILILIAIIGIIETGLKVTQAITNNGEPNQTQQSEEIVETNVNKRTDNTQDDELRGESVQNDVESKTDAPEEYIDLGLSSGTLWKISNEPDRYTFDRALDLFGDRLPTKEQCEELIAQCSWEWLGKGYRATGPNGRTIDFPLTGYRDKNGRMYNTDILGGYWTCTPGPSGVAWKLYIDNDEITMYRYHCNIGHAVRLVEFP